MSHNTAIVVATLMGLGYGVTMGWYAPKILGDKYHEMERSVFLLNVAFIVIAGGLLFGMSMFIFFKISGYCASVQNVVAPGVVAPGVIAQVVSGAISGENSEVEQADTMKSVDSLDEK